MADLTLYPLWIIFVASLAAFLLAVEIGHRIGAKTTEGANVPTLEAAVFGLLALMIGFTFSMALGRFEARRDALLSEANAIGTAALRARLLPAPLAEESLRLFHEYVQIRIHVSESDVVSEGSAALRHSGEVQESLWRLARAAAVKDNGMVPVGLYIQALNETFDDQQKRLTIVRNRVPNIVFIGLYAVAIVALWFSGYANAMDKRGWRLPTYVAGMLVAGVILLIQDLDRPGAGFITVSQQPMVDTARAVEGYLSEPASAAKSAK